ncbi:MAG TPA: histidine phosphatase family protein [Ktedonobacteraceae bacterium]|jgi:probable phosphoglycerate mutase|nr:histidine phosphatase family protein [Ktedonobacteraceae bacterium]
MTHLYLIRHGEATSQVHDVLRDDGLTPLGVRQAERLRERLAASGEIKPDVLLASTLPRARQTAEIIAPALKQSIVFDDELQELRLGEAEGMLISEQQQKFGRTDFANNPLHPIAPGGESWGQFVLRVGTVLDRIIRQYEGKTIVVVCHGGVIDSSFVYFFNMGSLFLPRAHFFTLNTSITYWRKSSSNRRPPFWRLVRYNDDFHVRDLESSQEIPWDSLSITDQERQRANEATTSQAEQ